MNYDNYKPTLKKLATACFKNPLSISSEVEVFMKTLPKPTDFLGFAQARVAELPLVKSATGLYLGSELKKECMKDPIVAAYYYIMMSPTRGFLASQTKSPGNDYCSLVPLVLASYKKYKDIPYNAWDPNEIKHIVHKPLAEAMLATLGSDDEDLIEVQKEALLIRSGDRAGGYRPANTTYAIYPQKPSAVHSLPKLAQHMVLQTWAAHPTNRTKYMILDLEDWDNMPSPLISEDAKKLPWSEGPEEPTPPWLM